MKFESMKSNFGLSLPTYIFIPSLPMFVPERRVQTLQSTLVR